MIKIFQKLQLLCQNAEQSSTENVRKKRNPGVDGNILDTGVNIYLRMLIREAVCVESRLLPSSHTAKRARNKMFDVSLRELEGLSVLSTPIDTWCLFHKTVRRIHVRWLDATKVHMPQHMLIYKTVHTHVPHTDFPF